MRFISALLALILLATLIKGTEGIFGGRRRRRLFKIRVPPIRFPPVRIPPIRLPIPPIRIPPVRIPPIRVDKIVRNPVVRAVVRAGEEVGKGITKGFNILTKGCCGLHPSYCSNRDEFQRRQKEIKSVSSQMDKDWATLKKLLENLKTVNNQNQIVFREVRRITLVSTLNVQTLDPFIISKMNNVSNELKKAIREKNDTILKYGIDQIADEYDKTKEEADTTILDASGIGGFGMTEGYVKMTADMFKLVKLDMVADFLEGDVLDFLSNAKKQVSKLFGFHYLEKLAGSNKYAKVALDVLKFYSDYLNVFNSVFKVMDLFGKFVAWITDLATCKKRKDEMATAIKDLRVQHNKINEQNKKLKDAKTTAQKNWALIYEETKRDGLLDNLQIAQSIAQNSARTSDKMKKAVSAISNYRNRISRSRPEVVVLLQKSLIYALGNISYNSECYQRKMATFEAVKVGCKEGRGSFDVLYERAMIDFRTNDDSCKDESGLPYTSKNEVRNFVNEKATKEKFERSCLLNSGLKKKVVCEKINEGFTVSQIIQSVKENQALVEMFAEECPVIGLTPNEKGIICEIKPFQAQDKIIAQFPHFKKEVVINALEGCGWVNVIS